MSSIVPPFVSGMKNTAQKNWQTIIAAKNAKVHDPAFSAAIGNVQLMMVQRNQCVKHPSAWPFARTVLGNTSDM